MTSSSVSQPNIEPERRRVARIRALSAHVRVDSRMSETRACHGRPPRSTSYRQLETLELNRGWASYGDWILGPLPRWFKIIHICLPRSAKSARRLPTFGSASLSNTALSCPHPRPERTFRNIAEERGPNRRQSRPRTSEFLESGRFPRIWNVKIRPSLSNSVRTWSNSVQIRPTSAKLASPN